MNQISKLRALLADHVYAVNPRYPGDAPVNKLAQAITDPAFEATLALHIHNGQKAGSSPADIATAVLNKLAMKAMGYPTYKAPAP